MIFSGFPPLSLRFTRASRDPVVDAAWYSVVDLGAPSTAFSTAATTAIFATTRMPASFGDVAQT